MTHLHLIEFIRRTLPMPLDKAQEIAERFKPRDFSKNEYLLKAGRICHESHIIEAGLMRSYIHDLDGNDSTTAFYSQGDNAADIFSFFRQEPSKENIQALTGCTTWYMSYEDMQINFHTLPEFREFGRQNLINNYGFLKARMQSLIQQSAEQRYADLLHSNPTIFQHAQLRHIASYLGITDTSLSRIRKEFIRK